MVLFLVFLVTGCSHIPVQPVQGPTPGPSAVLDVVFYDFGDVFSEQEQKAILSYVLKIKPSIPTGERWLVGAYAFSDTRWMETFGQFCSGLNILRGSGESSGRILSEGNEYRVFIWLGFALNSNRCLDVYRTHKEFQFLSGYNALFDEELKHEFLCPGHLYDILGVSWSGEFPSSCKFHESNDKKKDVGRNLLNPFVQRFQWLHQE